MSLNKSKLSPEAKKTSQNLSQIIATQISKNQGFLPFDQYMEMALYTPNLGYYSAGSHKFGATGDFITAPEISPLFSYCLAIQAQEIIEKANLASHYLEFGAGSGKMAADILCYLEQQNQLPESYTILELSADLKQRQQAYFSQLSPTIQACIQWSENLPQFPFNGVILANEVLDAMPIQRFKITQQGIMEYGVKKTATGFVEAWKIAPDGYFKTAVEKRQQQYSLPLGFISEISLRIPAWIQSLADCIDKGALLLIDYGHRGSDFYHAERYQGSLMCHYQHYAHHDPFVLVGLQDITADVDFSALADSATQAGMRVAGYTTQSHFLIDCGIESLLLEKMAAGEEIQTLSQSLKRLILPELMGEKFKVMALQKDIEVTDLKGFQSLFLRL